MLIWICILIGTLRGVEINFADRKDGYFLKPIYTRYRPAENNMETQTFMLTHPAELYKLRASLGQFDVYQSLPSDFVDGVYSSDFGGGGEDHLRPKSMHRQIFYNMDVSAHLVSDRLFLKHPLLQVLIHAQPLMGRKKQDLIYSYYGYSQQWCGQLFVQHGTEQFSSVCVLSDDHDTCAAGIHLPESWWRRNATFVSVYYDISRVEDSQECASASNTIIPARSLANSTNTQRKFIAMVPLVEEDLAYTEEKDQDLIFRIPTRGYRPGAKFEVPVLLERNSGLQVFVVRVKVRHGLRVLAAVPGEDSAWNIFFENNGKDRSASVTAYVKDSFKYTKSTRIEEIMRWQFEVEENTEESNTGRIVWTVDYEKNGLSRNSYFPPQDSRISAKITILGDHPESIVTVFKEMELLNTATLTGKREEYPLHVFAVSSSNKVRDVSSISDCFSTDSDVLRVAKDCRTVYLDGNETRGSENVTIVVRVGGHTTQVPLRVWVTDHRLDVELSDTKLSRVRGWSIPSHSQRRKRSNMDFGLLTNFMPATKPDDDDEDDEDNNSDQNKHDGGYNMKNCQLRMQQSTVEVYTRFVIDTDSGLRYFRGKKVYLRITDLVRRQLRVADPTIASIKGTVVRGHLPGRTEVQVLSAAGHVLGERKIRVGRGRVELSGIVVRVVSGLSLHIAKHRYLPGAFTATAVLENKLVARQQDALLDITLQYSDGTRMPLIHVDPDHFDLKLQLLSNQVVQVPSYPQSLVQPSIRAIGVGSGKLVKVLMRQPQGVCYYRRRPLAVAHVNIQVDFSKDGNGMGRVQSDAFFDNNRASERWQGDDTSKKNSNDHGPKFDPSPVDIDNHFLNKEDYFKHQHEKFPELSAVGAQDPKVIPVEIAFDKMEAATSVGTKKKPPRQEALEQAIDTGSSVPRPFVIGMYVMVSVFFVVTVNCVLFSYRYYRRKQAPKNGSTAGQQGSVSNAKDWVWIGRATLERNNAQNTRCMHALMPEEDFNGNQMPAHPPGPLLSNPPSVPNSNRNSTVSTYEGSECSIRITSNPLRDSGDVGFNEAEWDYEKLGLTYEQLMDYFENLKESTA